MLRVSGEVIEIFNYEFTRVLTASFLTTVWRRFETERTLVSDTETNYAPGNLYGRSILGPEYGIGENHVSSGMLETPPSRTKGTKRKSRFSSFYQLN